MRALFFLVLISAFLHGCQSTESNTDALMHVSKPTPQEICGYRSKADYMAYIAKELPQHQYAEIPTDKSAVLVAAMSKSDIERDFTADYVILVLHPRDPNIMIILIEGTCVSQTVVANQMYVMGWLQGKVFTDPRTQQKGT